MADRDADLSPSDGGPTGRVSPRFGRPGIRGPTLRSGSVLRGPTLPTSQISGPQVSAESVVVTIESQAVYNISDVILIVAHDSSIPDRASAATHTGSVDLSIASRG